MSNTVFTPVASVTISQHKSDSLQNSHQACYGHLSRIQPYTGQGRLRNLNLDHLSFINIAISSSASSSIRSPLYKSFFHTVIHEWNSLPLHIRVTPDTPNQVTNYFWSVLHNNSNNPT